MKTIEEQAKEYGLKVYQVWDSSVIATRAEDGFKAGAKAAQRWIPIEEELPEDSTDVLVKNDVNKIMSMSLFIDKEFHPDFFS